MKRFYRGWVTVGNHVETEKAICFEVSTGRFGGGTYPVWFPKSQIKWGEYAEGTNNREILIPTWLFTTKRLDPDRIIDIEWDQQMTVEA